MDTLPAPKSYVTVGNSALIFKVVQHDDENKVWILSGVDYHRIVDKLFLHPVADAPSAQTLP